MTEIIHKHLTYPDGDLVIEFWNKIPFGDQVQILNCKSKKIALELAAPFKPQTKETLTNTEPEFTGGSTNYYQVQITDPTTEGRPQYIAECNDIIEHLQMTFAEANMFKAIWRTAAARTLGKKKAGQTAKYDAEKIAFYAGRHLRQFKSSDIS